VRRVALLAPMPSELAPLRRPLSLRREGSGPTALYRGGLGGMKMVAALSGIGTAAAARATERVLDAGPADHLLVVGVAGGIGSSVRVGDAILPERVVDLASGASFRPDPLGRGAPRGTLLTSDRLLVDRAELARLADPAAFGAIAVDMETAAVAAVCERRGCPWSAFRAISDCADDGSVDAAVAALARPDGSADLPAALRLVLRQPWRVPQLVRLGRGLARATRAAAAAALRALEESA
jgi:nucleoside phosphorylase